MEASLQWAQSANFDEVSEKLRIKISKLKSIAVAWTFMAIVFAVVEHFTLTSDFSLGTANSYSFKVNLLFHLGATSIAIGLGATFLVLAVALLTVISQSMKSAQTNPAEVLKYE